VPLNNVAHVLLSRSQNNPLSKAGESRATKKCRTHPRFAGKRDNKTVICAAGRSITVFSPTRSRTGPIRRRTSSTQRQCVEDSLDSRASINMKVYFFTGFFAAFLTAFFFAAFFALGLGLEASSRVAPLSRHASYRADTRSSSFIRFSSRSVLTM
jgi:hypothetical protein